MEQSGMSAPTSDETASPPVEAATVGVPDAALPAAGTDVSETQQPHPQQSPPHSPVLKQQQPPLARHPSGRHNSTEPIGATVLTHGDASSGSAAGAAASSPHDPSLSPPPIEGVSPNVRAVSSAGAAGPATPFADEEPTTMSLKSSPDEQQHPQTTRSGLGPSPSRDSRIFDVGEIHNVWGNLMQWIAQRNAPKTKFRTVYVNHNRDTNYNSFCGNSISTTKYSLYSFLPKFLWEQFGRASNFFFLFTACIALVPQAAVIDPVLAVAPLVIVLLVGALKEIIEDIRRYLADRASNRQFVEIFTNGHFETKRWQDVVVGDILKFTDGNHMCADVIVLSTSEPQGVCFIETSSLDGETNLKVRQCPRETFLLQTEAQLAKLHATLECEHPNNRLYSFDGTLRNAKGLLMDPKASNMSLNRFAKEKGDEGGESASSSNGDALVELGPTDLSIGPNEILLRGSSIQNTKWIYGLVVNTGHETKLFKNSHASPIKQTAMQRQLNRQIFALFCFVMALAITMTVGRIVWDNLQNGQQPWYLPADEYAGIFQFLSGILLIQNVIPLGLFVELEVARFIQGLILASDPNMYYAEKDMPARAPSSTLNEELGQIGHIFSDKTGTLTQNKMVFRKCIINGKMYGGAPDELVGDKFDPEELKEDLAANDEQSEHIRSFLTILSVCHTVIPENKKLEDGSTIVKFQASSPDEFALVTAAHELGYSFKARHPDSVVVDVLGEKKRYEILQVNEFNSTRKRMSIVVLTPEGKLVLLMKGADNVMFERVATNDEEKAKKVYAEEKLYDYSRYGLRTLCLAMRELTDKEYKEWLVTYLAASTSLEDREKKLDEAAEKIEHDLVFVGATAIEDKLQDGVPETLVLLGRAGIRLWVLTGDKQETAINIGLSARILDENMDIMIANGDEAWLREFVAQKLEENITHNTPPHKLGLVINGPTLIHALETDIRSNFLKLTLLCKSVICCRVSPLQKAKVVLLVKENTKSVTLAIGDGANDVAMIQAAAIGVGILGEEGGQAARAADYAIGQFRFLQSLLLVHGNWNYFRQARLILYQFHIQLLYNMSLFYFSTISAWSEIVIFQNLLATLYYTVFTGVDIVFPTLLDRNIQQRKAIEYPESYASNVNNPLLTIKTFWIRWMMGLVHSIIIFVFVYFAVSHDGSDVFVMGNVLYVCIFISLKIMLYLDIKRITLVDITVITIAIVLFVICQLIFSYSMSTDDTFYVYYGVVTITSDLASSWFLFLLVPITVTATYIAYRYVEAYFFPDDFQILNEMSWVEKEELLGEVLSDLRHGKFQTAREKVTKFQQRSKTLALMPIGAPQFRHPIVENTFDAPDPSQSAVTQGALIRMYNTDGAKEEMDVHTREKRRQSIWKLRSKKKDKSAKTAEQASSSAGAPATTTTTTSAAEVSSSSTTPLTSAAAAPVAQPSTESGSSTTEELRDVQRV